MTEQPSLAFPNLKYTVISVSRDKHGRRLFRIAVPVSDMMVQATIRDFFDACRGRYHSFRWVEPTSQEDVVVRFGSDYLAQAAVGEDQVLDLQELI